jgi:hypothetical protein
VIFCAEAVLLMVSVRLLPRSLGLYAGAEVCVIDKVVKEGVPGFSDDAGVPEHVF